MIVAPIPIVLPISLVDPVEIIVSAMSFLEPHAVRLILMIIPDMLVMVPSVLITTIIFSLSALLIPMVVLGQCRYWSHQCGAQKTNAIETC
jgi:hypothetical protein